MSAKTTKFTFGRETTVSITIHAQPERIWSLLTDASAYPSWNTTIISIEGSIASGQKIKLTSTLDPKRVFNLAIKDFVPSKRLSWGDMMGTRVYTLTPGADGQTVFTMTEKIGGLMYPLFAGMIPSFDASFDAFAHDLKKAAEKKG